MRFFTTGIYIILLLSQAVHSQNLSDSLIKNYLNYTSNTKEQIFFATQKQQFLINETIYFSGFLKNTQDTIVPSSIVQVSLYNAKSKLIKSSLHPVETNTYYGSFLLDISPGKYILTVSTVNEIGENISNIISHPIIVNQLSSEKHKSRNTPELYVQPEAGELVIGFKNTVGFYISTLDQSSTSIKQILLKDSLGKIIHDSITLIGQNFGSFKLSPKRNTSYHLEILLDNDIILKKKLPTPVVKEIYFTTNALLNDKVLITYEFSETFINSIPSVKKNITIAIHNYNNINTIPLSLNKSKGSITIPRSVINNQVNIISIFDDTLDILYDRFIYNTKNTNALSVNFKSKKRDSTTIHITPQKEIKHLNFSITTLLNKPPLPVYSQLFGGYGKNIRFDDYFLFNNISRKKDAQIDILCLSLGKSTINWKDIIQGTFQKVKKHTSNFSIIGKTKQDLLDKETSITLYQKSIGAIYTADMKKEGIFSIPDLYLIKDEQIYYSLLPALKEKISIDFDIYPKIIAKETLDTVVYNNYKNWLIPTLEKTTVTPFNPSTDQEVLDEVTLTVKRDKTVFTRNTQLSEGIYDAKKIDEKLIKKFPKVSQYIRTLGFRVFADAASGGFSVSGKSFFDSPPIIYVDGFITRGRLQDRLLSAIDEIYFEHTGFEGSNGGTLYIYTQKSGRYESNQELGKVIAYQGFERKEPFFTNASTSSKVMYWKPTIATLSKTNTVTFPDYGKKKFKLIAYTFDKQGNFTIEEHPIYTTSNE